jgi:hypothetical protein
MPEWDSVQYWTYFLVITDYSLRMPEKVFYAQVSLDPPP